MNITIHAETLILFEAPLISPGKEFPFLFSQLRRAQDWHSPFIFFNVRDVYQNDWRELATPDAVRRALAILEDAGWVRVLPTDNKTNGGRPSELYALNPKVSRAK